MAKFTNEQLIQLCNSADWGEFTITMNNGDVLTIIPCTQDSKPCCQQNVEYFLVYGPLPWMGEDTVEKLVQSLNNYEKSLAEAEESKSKIQDFFKKHIETGDYDADTWSMYSDWHKDVYGFRPRGLVCGVRI